MTENVICTIDHQYISDFYENGLEGAHYAIASSLHAISALGDLEVPGMDEEAYGNVLRSHVIVLDTLLRNMLIVSEAPHNLSVIPKK